MQISPQLDVPYKFCMMNVNYKLLMENVILLSLLTILQQYISHQ